VIASLISNFIHVFSGRSFLTRFHYTHYTVSALAQKHPSPKRAQRYSVLETSLTNGCKTVIEYI